MGRGQIILCVSYSHAPLEQLLLATGAARMLKRWTPLSDLGLSVAFLLFLITSVQFSLLLKLPSSKVFSIR